MTERVRSFIAVPIAPALAGRLEAAQEALREAGPDVKWVARDCFHITLKFLGEVEMPRLAALWDSVEEALEGASGFPVSLRGVGAFPNTNRPRVIWVAAAEGAAELKALAAAVEKACGTHGFPAEERPFRSHLTLGRVRRPAANARLEAAIEQIRDHDVGPTEADRVLLMKSDLTPRGPIYHILKQTMLANGGGQ